MKNDKPHKADKNRRNNKFLFIKYQFPNNRLKTVQ